MTKAEMWLGMEAVPVGASVGQGGSHPPQIGQVWNGGAGWMEDTDDAAHQWKPSQLYGDCDSVRASANAFSAPFRGRKRRAFAGISPDGKWSVVMMIEEAERKGSAPPLASGGHEASWPSRLPWPLAVLFIFVLGIALWWGVFRLASMLIG